MAPTIKGMPSKIRMTSQPNGSFDVGRTSSSATSTLTSGTVSPTRLGSVLSADGSNSTPFGNTISYASVFRVERKKL